ncbi:response regulator [Devosia submarina]|uniref:response regulator n=1 Tax=Devosia submarina TaxID=1173082 RepID=UPI000D380BF3|nr:response regulator [Devosia submarina]
MIQNLSVALLLEDEAIIAMDMEQALGDAGFDVSTAMTCAAAEAWLLEKRPDVAIVDITLRDGSSEAIVARFVEDGVPFVVHSGDLPLHHQGTPYASGIWVDKPATREALIDAANAAIKRR